MEYQVIVNGNKRGAVYINTSIEEKDNTTSRQDTYDWWLKRIEGGHINACIYEENKLGELKLIIKSRKKPRQI